MSEISTFFIGMVYNIDLNSVIPEGSRMVGLRGCVCRRKVASSGGIIHRAELGAGRILRGLLGDQEQELSQSSDHRK